MNEFLEKIMELGAAEDRCCSEAERQMIFKEVEEVYNSHLTELKLFCQPAFMPSCEGNYGMNYCDDNGCIERKRILVEPKDLPEHEA
jgi:hypothetical protein